MKQFLAIALSLPFLVAAQKPVELVSKINAVVVYTAGAQMEHTASKSLPAGRQTIVFTGLSSEINAQSVGVSASAGVSVLSVSTQLNHLKTVAKSADVKMLEDSLRSLEFDHRFNQSMLDIYVEEKHTILANRNVGWGGNEGEFLIEDLEDLADFYRTRLADNALKYMEVQAKQPNLEKNISRIRRQLEEHNHLQNRSTGEVLVEVNVAAATTASFKLTYMVQSAGWSPIYNVRVADVDKPLQLTYNASVYQNTGVDWSDVSLTLTNANPFLSGDKPVLAPWYLRFLDEYNMQAQVRHKTMQLEVAQVASAGRADVEFEDLSATVSYAMNEAATQFQLKAKYTVASDAKPQVMPIDEYTLPAQYEYFCAPSVELAAFLVARVTGFDEYDLLAGNANLFFGNSFVGEIFLDPKQIGDTLDVSLGRDQSLVVQREKVNEFSATKKIGSSTKESLAYEISVRNTKATAVKLVVQDQVPVSSNKEIEVEIEEVAGAKMDDASGKLTWVKNIAPSAADKWQFRYAVKYPSGRLINL